MTVKLYFLLLFSDIVVEVLFGENFIYEKRKELYQMIEGKIANFRVAEKLIEEMRIKKL